MGKTFPLNFLVLTPSSQKLAWDSGLPPTWFTSQSQRVKQALYCLDPRIFSMLKDFVTNTPLDPSLQSIPTTWHWVCAYVELTCEIACLLSASPTLLGAPWGQPQFNSVSSCPSFMPCIQSLISKSLLKSKWFPFWQSLC